MTLRQAYADAPGQGTVVWDMATRARDAAAEIERLFGELLPDVAAQGMLTTTHGGST
jgi:chromosome partitioning protein